MLIFGRKKLSIAEIEKGIEEMTAEERAALLERLQSESAKTTETETPADEGTETAETVNEETVAPVEEPKAEVTDGEATETEAVDETEDETTEGVEPATVTDTPMETPTGDGTEEAQTPNYDELIAAQNAKIESLESIVTALKETFSKVVANQDNQNFGYSPNADFNDEASQSRHNAVMESYAPRRAEQYK